MSRLVIFEILEMFVNTFIVDDTYSFRNNENLPQLIQMQLSKKHEFFLIFLLVF